MPCGDINGKEVHCSLAPSANLTQLTLVVSGNTSCEESQIHTRYYGKYTVRMQIKPTVEIKEGCSYCDVYFTPSIRTNDSIRVSSILVMETDHFDLHAREHNGRRDQCQVSRRWCNYHFVHQRGQDIFALPLVHGRDSESAISAKTWKLAEARMHYGITDRDYTADVSWSIRFHLLIDSLPRPLCSLLIVDFSLQHYAISFLK